jgi:tRNA nucleotidyltransferase (CCA-adding enzyme)
VVDADGCLCGYLSLRDVVKGRRAERMDAPVRAYMTSNAVVGSPSMSLREIENLFFSHTIYDLPIVKDGKMVGVVTRDGYLKARAGE